MATEAQIERVLKRLEQVHPANCFKRMDEVQAGIGAVLRLLYESNEAVTAGKISEVLGVSTARVAVLLRKMVSKGLVTKEQGVMDARITIVRLTEFGMKKFKEMKDDMCEQMGMVIDAIGEERLMEFIAIAEEIQKTIAPPRFIT
ncbi:MAG: winged helix DNA-binding protein [Eubacterium sp.]|nr:winged helix DNA-binding protein [Eubacterium sp.]